MPNSSVDIVRDFCSSNEPISIWGNPRGILGSELVGRKIIEKLEKNKSLQVEIVFNFSELIGSCAKMNTALIVKGEEERDDMQSIIREEQIDLTTFDFRNHCVRLEKILGDVK